jgi:transposase-like protein
MSAMANPLACPRCGASMHLFESFPARSGLPEVHVFECASCKEMILRDRSRPAAPHAVADPLA